MPTYLRGLGTHLQKQPSFSISPKDMRHQIHQALNRHRGFSLIEIMVGLAIGLLAVLSITTAYSILASHVEGSKDEPGIRDKSIQDGHLALGIVTMQYDLQRAGFGIDKPTMGVDLVTEGSPIHSLGWRWRDLDSNVIECAAMRYRGVNSVDTVNEQGIIETIPLMSNCSFEATPLSTVFTDKKNSIQVVAANVPRLEVTINSPSNSCYLGSDASNPGIQVKLQSYLSLGGLPVMSNFCLYNFTS